ncbi:hypothetical protein E4U21_006699 [Claviceps maximensis]|nr:hypothetical protein E4U21_006699 [Claviceps maximensis]
MAPPIENKRSPSDIDAIVERQVLLAANETSRAFIGGYRPSWISDVSPSPTCTPASQKRVRKIKSGRVRPRNNTFAAAAPEEAIAPQSVSVIEDRIIRPNSRYSSVHAAFSIPKGRSSSLRFICLLSVRRLSELILKMELKNRDSGNIQAEDCANKSSPEVVSDTLPRQKVPSDRSENFILRSDEVNAINQNEQRATVPRDSSHPMPFSEQDHSIVANLATSTAAPRLKIHHNNIQMRNFSNASSPTITEQGGAQTKLHHLADSLHPSRQLSEPSRVQVAHVTPSATHVTAHPASGPPLARGLPGDLSRHSQPISAVLSASTQTPAQAPAQAPAQTRTQTQVQAQAATQASSQKACEVWRQSILERLALLERTGISISSLEDWRYQKLTKACSQGDLIYLYFHRMLCRWSISSTHPLALKISDPDLNAALVTLQQYLRPVSEMAIDHVMWFMHFPWDPIYPSSFFAFHNTHDQAVFKFLKLFAQRWRLALDAVVQRRFPLLMHELMNMLECPSEILRDSLYTASCSFLGSMDRSVAVKLPAIFQIDKRNEMLAASNMLEPTELARKRQAVIAQYRVALQDADPHQSRPHALATAPILSSARTTSSTLRSYQQNSAFVTANDTGQAANATHTSHQLASNFNVVSRDNDSLGSRATKVSVQLTNPNPYTGAQAQRSSQLSCQQAVSIESHRNAGNSVTPHAGRPSHQNGHMMSLPALAGIQMPTSATNTTYLSSPNAVSDSQVRGRSLHSRRNRPPQSTPSSISTLIPGLISSQPHGNESQRYSTVPLTQGQYPHTAWMSVQNGLHLVRLRSPERTNSGGTGTRYYQFLSRFAFDPTPIFPQKGIQRFKFAVTADEFRFRSELERIEDNTMHHFKNGSLRYRLRLIRRDQKSSVVDNISWVAFPSIWPAEIYMMFNDEPVYPRRAPHFRHDLPIELTDLLHEGLNTISISLPQSTGSSAETLSYHLAVEIIVTMDHASTLDMICKQEKVGADQTRCEIRRRMQHTISDDVIVKDDCLCISLIDPFSASMFSIPVRGVACKHIECFDLQTWLQTRLSKDSQSRSEPSLVDGWKCPICNGDAAPPNIRVDEFLLEVQQALTLADKGQTRSISVYLDGSWIANEEPGDDAFEGREGQSNKNSSKQLPAARKEPEIIEILDD